MEKLKKIIIILSIICVLVLICILAINKNIQENNFNDGDEYIVGASPEDFAKDLGEVESYGIWFSVEEMLQKFINEVKYGDTQAMCGILDSSYIAEKNITQENVLTKISDMASYASNVKIRKIHEEKSTDNAIYYIDCILEKEHNGKEFYFILYKDERSLTYSVEPIEKTVYENSITNIGTEIEAKRIEKNKYNKSSFVNPTEEEIAKKYFEDFLENALYYPEYTYSLLKEDYREKCFTTLQDFNDYIETKREMYLSNDITNLKESSDFETIEEYRYYLENIERLKLEQYQIRPGENYDRYICIDSEGNYYIFYAVSPLNYTVVLGNYATPTQEFIEEYNSNAEVKKVILNIKRFFMGIDDKNYGYSYSVLSDAFKANKYPTKENFINYAKQNFFEENEIEYISYEKQNQVYVYKIKIKDATGKISEEKEFNMIIKLNSGTDFEMSFGQ